MTDEWAYDGLHFLCQNRANCLTVIQMVGEAPHSMIFPVQLALRGLIMYMVNIL